MLAYAVSEVGDAESDDVLAVPGVEGAMNGPGERGLVVPEAVVGEQLCIRAEPHREAHREQVIFGAKTCSS